MLISADNLINTPVFSMQSANAIGFISSAVIDPTSLKIIAFYLDGALINKATPILDVSSIREYSSIGIVIDSIDELVSPTDVIKISKAINLNFNPIGLKVETKKGSHLGRTISYNASSDNFQILQIIVKRPLIKSFTDSELTIPRKEIVEITDHKFIVKDEEDVIKKRATKEDFIPNFVNPFRKTDAPAHAHTEEEPETQPTEV
jgi:uncharacterized protein YrrD